MGVRTFVVGVAKKLNGSHVRRRLQADAALRRIYNGIADTEPSRIRGALSRAASKVESAIYRHAVSEARRGVDSAEVQLREFDERMTREQRRKAIRQAVRSVSRAQIRNEVAKQHRTASREIDRYLRGAKAIGREPSRAAIRSFVRLRGDHVPTEAKSVRPGRGRYRSAHANAKRITRARSNRAYQEGHVRVARARGYGLQWRLSPGHPHSDVCDGLASANEYGLGAGVYPASAFPDRPHPNCLCYQVYVRL